MRSPKAIEIEQFDYLLPDKQIAKYPLGSRHMSKLLVSQNTTFREDVFLHLDQHLDKDTLLFFNNTKVFQARFFFQKPSGSVIEIFCLEPSSEKDLQQAFAATKSVEWVVYIGNNKRWKEPFLEKKIAYGHREITLKVEKRQMVKEAWKVLFSWDIPVPFEEILTWAGQMPLPPYLNRQVENNDRENYQTIYAQKNGSVAAPTAGLHFTPEIFEKLHKKGITTDFFTLHVGAGTFKPVSSKTIGEHEMHWEKIYFSLENIKQISHFLDKKIIAVGTTSVRALESLYWHGLKWLNKKTDIHTIEIEQWEPYSERKEILPPRYVFEQLLKGMEESKLNNLQGTTQIMIVPGYQFQVIKGIVTNFHQPKSTLLLLVSAFMGDSWKEMYHFALKNQFRFLSYGDGCLLL